MTRAISASPSTNSFVKNGKNDLFVDEKVEQSPKSGEKIAEKEALPFETSNPEAAIALPSPPGPFVQERWNYPKENLWRTIVACFGLLIMGANDAAFGALIPYLETYYNISYTVISIIFISPILGYGASALTNNAIHMKFGQRGVAIIGPSTRLAAYVIMSQHPPYPVLVLCFVLAGYGNGLEDAGWNAWVGNMQNANEVLGFLHGAYGLGGTLAPLLATSLITKVHWGWWTFYYFMFGAVATELVFASWAFWGATGQVFRDSHPNTSKGKGSRTKEALNSRIVWICAAFLLVYVGIEVSLGGWVVSFMINIRNVGNFDAGISTTGYWAGITAGRVILGFITTRIGEKEAILIYIGLALGFHLVFYFVPSIPVSFLAVALEGFFLGPLFPGAVVAATKILPPHLHVSGIGFAAAIGAAGACLLPFAVGAIAQAKGVQVLMPIVLAMFVLDAAIWYMLPSLKKKNPVDSENSSDLVESKEKKRFRMPWKKS